MLFALGGISVDLWRSFSARRALAAGADAAALAGASAIDEARYRASGALSLLPATAEHRARASLDRQLDQSDRRGADVRATDESVTVVVRGTVELHAPRSLRWRQLRHRSRGHRDASAVAVKLVAVVLVVVAMGLGGGSAHAQTGGGELGPGSVRATARDLGTGTYPGSGVAARAPSTESLFSWNRQVSSLVCVILGAPPSPELAPQVSQIPGPTAVTNQVIGPGDPVDIPAGAVAVPRLLVPPDAVVVGDLVYDVGEQPTLLLVLPRCIQPGTPLLGEPPSPAEIWQETPLPRTEVHATPARDRSSWPGITRLATFFWGTTVPETSAQRVAAWLRRRRRRPPGRVRVGLRRGNHAGLARRRHRRPAHARDLPAPGRLPGAALRGLGRPRPHLLPRHRPRRRRISGPSPCPKARRTTWPRSARSCAPPLGGGSVPEASVRAAGTLRRSEPWPRAARAAEPRRERRTGMFNTIVVGTDGSEGAIACGDAGRRPGRHPGRGGAPHRERPEAHGRHRDRLLGDGGGERVGRGRAVGRRGPRRSWRARSSSRRATRRATA